MNTEQTEVAVARQSAGRRNADEPQVERDVVEDEEDQARSGDAEDVTDDEDEDVADPEDEAADDDPDDPEDADDEDEAAEDEAAEVDDERSAETDSFWESVRVDVIEIALPRGVGYTLRAYRAAGDVTPTDVSDREPDAFPERNRPARAFVEDEKAIVDDYDYDEEEEDEDLPGGRGHGDDDVLDDDTAESEDDDESEEQDEDDEEETDEEGEDAATPTEDVPVFLGGRGHLYLFRSPEGLVEFVRSGDEHDLSQIDTWSEVVERITPADVVPLPEDRYELDLVVENLRGGYDAWDPELLIQAGEVARDLAYALRLQSVMDTLAPGTPMDDLDEVMRTASGGGFSAFFARRKLKKIGAEAAPLGWRTIIGKISAAVDWRD